MANRLVRYYFGRLNIVAAREDKGRLLSDGLAATEITTHRGLKWGFFEMRALQTADGEFVHGFLVKFKPLTEEEVAVPETHQIDDRTVENRITAKARFFLHVRSHIIAYHPFGREISRTVFVNRFKELFEGNLDGFFVDVEILPIDEEHGIRDAMRELDRISEVQVRLHPSNPSNRALWKQVDERLKAIGVSSYREDYETDPGSDGLSIRGDADLNRKIAMAEDGYGTVRVVGRSGGERKDITTRDAPVTAAAASDDEQPEVVLERLADTLRRLLDRFGE